MSEVQLQLTTLEGNSMTVFRLSTLIRVPVYGGVVVLASSVWAWALGFAVWHGAVAGAVLGIVLGVLMDMFMQEFDGADDLRGLARFVFGSGVMLLFLALSIVGAIVGLVIRLVS